jgi:predicted negative regulator of RcsB-dependent stress response
MAHFNLEEQEQIAKVKYFWKDWGLYIAIFIIVLIVGYAGNSAYSWHQQNQASKAAAVYASITTAVTANDSKQVYTVTDDLIKNLPGTEYAALASLQAAKMAFTAKDYALATKYLSWAKDNASDKSLQSIAILRLASVDIDQQKFDDARKLLMTKHDLAFDGLFYESRGDMYIAMGDLNKARDAYKEGLQKAANDPSTSQAIQMKLDIIGG